jgi:predicted GNAT family acetyltransferase
LLSPAGTESHTAFSQHFKGAAHAVQVEVLTEDYKDAVLAFLSERPIQTVILAGWIRERGIESPAHRGTFYGCWNAHGILEGVALVGKATMFEARTEAALTAFAELARENPSVHLFFAESSAVESFWQSYRGETEREPQMVCRELLYEKEAEPFGGADAAHSLRRAEACEVLQVASAHAQLILAETGVNPLEKDADGFYQRCATRIAEGKVWVLMEDGELIFKADSVAETPEAVYVEGLWVNPVYRRRGYGKLCWQALSRALLGGGASLCGFVNEDNSSARSFYQKVGCTLRARFQKVFV